MKKTDLSQDPIDKQVLWMKVRTNKTPGTSQFKLVPVIAKSTWHRGNSGVDERYLTVVEYDRDRTHEVHLQSLQAMTEDEAEQYPLISATEPVKRLLRRKDLAKRLAKRLKQPEAKALAWIQYIEEEISLALVEGSTIVLTGFAKFSTATRKAQNAHDIRTGGTTRTNPRRRLLVKGGDILHRRLTEEVSP
jgi:nucleoid DNA-binding protein